MELVEHVHKQHVVVKFFSTSNVESKNIKFQKMLQRALCLLTASLASAIIVMSGAT